MAKAVLEIEGLCVSFRSGRGRAEVLRDVINLKNNFLLLVNMKVNVTLMVIFLLVWKNL